MLWENSRRGGLKFTAAGRIIIFGSDLALVAVRAREPDWRSTPVGASPLCFWSPFWSGIGMNLDHIQEIATRVARSAGLELFDVEMRGGGKGRMLRIVVDKPEGVTHDDCAYVSREMSAILDVEDAVPGGSYTLEVSSPGLDRKLRGAADFARFTGSRLKLMTREPVEKNRHWEGRLEQFDGQKLTLDTSVASRTKQKKMGGLGRKIEIELSNVERANLVPEI
jgi:ribosome maturation factor RimP